MLCSGAVVGMPCIFPSMVAGVNISTCTKIDGDEVKILRMVVGKITRILKF